MIMTWAIYHLGIMLDSDSKKASFKLSNGKRIYCKKPDNTKKINLHLFA